MIRKGVGGSHLKNELKMLRPKLVINCKIRNRSRQNRLHPNRLEIFESIKREILGNNLHVILKGCMTENSIYFSHIAFVLLL